MKKVLASGMVTSSKAINCGLTGMRPAAVQRMGQRTLNMLDVRNQVSNGTHEATFVWTGLAGSFSPACELGGDNTATTLCLVA